LTYSTANAMPFSAADQHLEGSFHLSVNIRFYGTYPGAVPSPGGQPTDAFGDSALPKPTKN
jgi:hypothetical protein